MAAALYKLCPINLHSGRGLSSEILIRNSSSAGKQHSLNKKSLLSASESTSRKLWRMVAQDAAAGLQTAVSAEGSDPISLATAKLPANLDLKLMESLLFQWGNSLTQNAMPMELPLKVDKIPGGVRLAYISISSGFVEELVYIDVVVIPASDGSGAFFQAERNGKLKNSVPPGEPAIMQSLLKALKTSIQLATKRQ